MIEVERPFHGMICNRHDGEVTPAGLRIPVADATVLLAGGENEITVDGKQIKVFYDVNSFPRARFSLDDNILFLRDITLNADVYRSIFDNWFLAFHRTLHSRYGARFHFNLFYEDNSFFKDFTLADMTDKFRSEWRDNADWLRLTFHSRAEFPDKPYIASGYDAVRRDCEAVTEQIIRFAGEELLSSFTTVHWGHATREGCRALRDLGFRGLVGYFEERDGKPFVAYYLDSPQQRHLFGRDYWKDPDLGLIFVKTDMVVNLVPLGEVVPRLDALSQDKHRSEVIELMIHEQYFQRQYAAWQPDAMEKVESAVRWVTERGYRWVFFDEGFVGA